MMRNNIETGCELNPEGPRIARRRGHDPFFPGYRSIPKVIDLEPGSSAPTILGPRSEKTVSGQAELIIEDK